MPDKLSDVPDLGDLIRTRRKARRWTQMTLSEEAFGSPSRHGHISRIETGKALPTEGELEKLAKTLGLSEEDLASVGPSSVPDVSAAFLDSIKLTEELLGSLAKQFGHDNPRASVGDYESFLRAKAGELRALQARIEAMGAAEGRIANLMGAAESALEAGDFPEADRLLADAEEMQQTEHTLVQVRKQAEIREARGDAALLNNDAEAAAAHFDAASTMFEPFDRAESSQRRDGLAQRLYRHGLRFGGAGLATALALCEKNCTLHDETTEPHDWARAHNNLGLPLFDLGQRLGGEAGMRLLSRAVEAYEAALRVRTEDAHPVDWAMTQNNLAIALQTQGARAGGEAGMRLLSCAVEAYEAALRVYTEGAHPVDWAATQNNLANALQTQGARAGGEPGMRLLSRAVEACEAALRVRTEDAHPVDWAMTQNNLAIALRTLGARAGGEAGMRLLSRAVEAYQAALRVRTEDAHPVDWAMTRNNLAAALQTQGARAGGEAGMRLLSRAIEAYEAALRVYTKEVHPVHWAATQANIGLAFMAMAQAASDQAAARLRAAIDAFDRALTVFDPETMPYDHEKATSSRAEAAARLEALSPAG